MLDFGRLKGVPPVPVPPLSLSVLLFPVPPVLVPLVQQARIPPSPVPPVSSTTQLSLHPVPLVSQKSVSLKPVVPVPEPESVQPVTVPPASLIDGCTVSTSTTIETSSLTDHCRHFILDFKCLESGKLFLPTSQLPQLFPSGKAVDVLSVCPRLADDTIWEGWRMSHVSLVAVIRMLVKFGDMFGWKEDLEVKQELADLERKTGLMDRQEETITMQLVEDKEQFLARMGLCRTEMVGHMKMNIEKRRDMARSGTRLMRQRRKNLPAKSVVVDKRARRGKAAKKVKALAK